MCLLLLAHNEHPQFSLVVAANRDEFYDRPAAPADFWPDQPGILGGRDIQGNGTWLAVNRRGAFAAITNVRLPGSTATPRSRGLIVTDYLSGKHSAADFVANLTTTGPGYAGFNFVARDAGGLAWYSNHAKQARTLKPGVYGLSNHLLDTPWPKVQRLKRAFSLAAGHGEDSLVEALFDALTNEDVAPDPDLPDTGLDLAYERVLSPIFINGTSYGTRCSSLLLIRRDGHAKFTERRFGPGKVFLGECSFEFEIESVDT